MQPPDLCPTRCAICNTEGNVVELYPANFVMEALHPIFFSARRVPDRIHYRIVKCSICGLVRSDPVADSRILGQLYAQSTFDYGDEVDNLKLTYGYYLSKLNKYDVQKRTLLEIGCGNGFFLEEGLKQGYVNVLGVEPSADAVARANSKVRSQIICDMMRPGLFGRGQFDVICMFQVLDHIADPAGLLAECYHVLKPGGLILCINHNIEAISARLLRNRSPIVDISILFYIVRIPCDIFFPVADSRYCVSILCLISTRRIIWCGFYHCQERSRVFC
jgi:SAM-dependent methyltransferase